MTNYINDNAYSDLTSESIETLYRKIFNDLIEKQKHVLTDDEKSVFETIIEKKSLKYSIFKENFKTMLDIQLPIPGVLSSFVRSNELFMDGFNVNSISPLFKEFRIDCAKSGMKILNECLDYLKKNESKIDSSSTKEASKCIFLLLESNDLINTTEFFKKYKICLSILFCYKFMEF